MMAARWQARPATGGPFIRSAVQISFTVSAVNRPKACGGCPSGRVVSSRAENQRWMARSEGAQPSRAARIRRTCAAVRAGFSIFRPTASSTTSASVRGAHCRGAGTSASNPPSRRATTHRSSVRRDTGTGRPNGPSCSRAASWRTTAPRCRAVRAGSIAGSVSAHRHNAMVCARWRRAAASRSAAVIIHLLGMPGMSRNPPTMAGPAAVTKAKQRPRHPGSC